MSKIDSKDPLDVSFRDRTKLDAYEDIQYVMACIHGVMYHGLESIMKHLETNVKLEEDLNNWLNYVQAWIGIVHDHHHHEELYLFPELRTHGYPLETEQEQHDKLHEDLDKVSEVVKKYKANHSKYSSKELKDLLTELQPNFYAHLREEVENLTRDRLEKHISQDQLRTTAMNWENHAKKSGNPIITFPYLMTHTPSNNKYWTALPSFIYRYLVPFFLWIHKGYWKYSPEPCYI